MAILDFGLVTEIDDNIKYGMIEAISHLIHRDYEAIVEDFVTLQFIDPGTNLTPILPVLAKVFSDNEPAFHVFGTHQGVQQTSADSQSAGGLLAPPTIAMSPFWVEYPFFCSQQTSSTHMLSTDFRRAAVGHMAGRSLCLLICLQGVYLSVL